MIFLKLLGIALMIGFVSLLRGLGEAAASVPMAEGWDEEEFSTNDPVRFRVESEEWKPVSIEREF